jgi:hypothetical protein
MTVSDPWKFLKKSNTCVKRKDSLEENQVFKRLPFHVFLQAAAQLEGDETGKFLSTSVLISRALRCSFSRFHRYENLLLQKT